MRFSVITVCRNAEAVLEATIRSVLDQDDPNWELIVIDGASTDGTPEILDRYRDRIAHMVSEPDSGIYDAMNKGLAAAAGDYLYFLNAGDRFDRPTVLSEVRAALRPSMPDLAGGRVLIEGRPPTPRHPLSRALDRFLPLQGEGANTSADPTAADLLIEPLADRIRLFYNPPPQQAFFYHRKTFAECGPFDQTFRIAGDYEWLLRCVVGSVHSYRILDLVVARYAWGGISNDARHASKNRAELTEAVDRHYGRLERLAFPRWAYQFWMRFPRFRVFCGRLLSRAS
jgi:glycosyltransferase involved in cell wall biosynthesis